MNFHTAAIVGAATALLSFLAGLIGGVPFFDIVLRALFWGILGFGGSLGIEALLRNFLPDLFVPGEGAAGSEENAPERTVDIVLEEEPSAKRGGFIEEVGEDDVPAAPRTRVEASGEPLPVSQAPSPFEPAAETEEEMPEIGAFLDAFKPSPAGEGEAEASSPEYGDYAPVDRERPMSQDVTIDGEGQDPVTLAKAVQTIMKRDV
jgi:hypothetical protein